VASVNLIERSVAADDRKFALRALRKNSALRRRLSAALFARVLPLYYPESQKDLLARLLSFTNTVAPKPSVCRIICIGSERATHVFVWVCLDRLHWTSMQRHLTHRQRLKLLLAAIEQRYCLKSMRTFAFWL
jgi:hypothetical protein